ncbi:hypothetical protein [Streptomyces sp. NPDC001508]|uniref:hypothetical protein n=1 Tax=Streptomyces sp. NPDC001508 TaxID=3154656 RepID=UPI00331F88A1
MISSIQRAAPRLRGKDSSAFGVPVPRAPGAGGSRRRASRASGTRKTAASAMTVIGQPAEA